MKKKTKEAAVKVLDAVEDVLDHISEKHAQHNQSSHGRGGGGGGFEGSAEKGYTVKDAKSALPGGGSGVNRGRVGGGRGAITVPKGKAQVWWGRSKDRKANGQAKTAIAKLEKMGFKKHGTPDFSGNVGGLITNKYKTPGGDSMEHTYRDKGGRLGSFQNITITVSE